MKPVQIYLGAPQIQKLPVYESQQGQQTTIKQMILSNTAEVDAKLTVTINTIDIMKDLIVEVGETKVIDLSIVLNSADRLSLQQEKANAINAMISGVLEQNIY